MSPLVTSTPPPLPRRIVWLQTKKLDFWRQTVPLEGCIFLAGFRGGTTWEISRHLAGIVRETTVFNFCLGMGMICECGCTTPGHLVVKNMQTQEMDICCGVYQSPVAP